MWGEVRALPLPTVQIQIPSFVVNTLFDAVDDVALGSSCCCWLSNGEKNTGSEEDVWYAVVREHFEKMFWVK